MSLPTIDVAGARRLLDQGAVLVDVREADEHARERVPGARSNPLSRLAPVEDPSPEQTELLARTVEQKGTLIATMLRPHLERFQDSSTDELQRALDEVTTWLAELDANVPG